MCVCMQVCECVWECDWMPKHWLKEEREWYIARDNAAHLFSSLFLPPLHAAHLLIPHVPPSIHQNVHSFIITIITIYQIICALTENYSSHCHIQTFLSHSSLLLRRFYFMEKCRLEGCGGRGVCFASGQIRAFRLQRVLLQICLFDLKEYWLFLINV